MRGPLGGNVVMVGEILAATAIGMILPLRLIAALVVRWWGRIAPDAG